MSKFNKQHFCLSLLFFSLINILWHEDRLSGASTSIHLDLLHEDSLCTFHVASEHGPRWCSHIFSPHGADVKSPQPSVHQTKSIATEFRFVALSGSLEHNKNFLD